MADVYGASAPLMYRGGMTADVATHGDFDVSVGVGGNTNTRVAAMLLAAGGILAALKWGGIRFNVGVTR